MFHWAIISQAYKIDLEFWSEKKIYENVHIFQNEKQQLISRMTLLETIIVFHNWEYHKFRLLSPFPIVGAMQFLLVN